MEGSSVRRHWDLQAVPLDLCLLKKPCSARQHRLHGL